jgi:putative transposase
MEKEQSAIYFFTATILEWKPLLFSRKYKEIILASLKFLIERKRIELFAFVIMPNHIHLIWKINKGQNKMAVQRDFLKYTAQRIKHDLVLTHPALLEKFRVNAKDRKYQIWERNALSIVLFSKKVYEQKLGYIHRNPVQKKWKLADSALEYKYSSIRFYEGGFNEWAFLKAGGEEF